MKILPSPWSSFEVRICETVVDHPISDIPGLPPSPLPWPRHGSWLRYSGSSRLRHLDNCHFRSASNQILTLASGSGVNLGDSGDESETLVGFLKATDTRFGDLSSTLIRSPAHFRRHNFGSLITSRSSMPGLSQSSAVPN